VKSAVANAYGRNLHFCHNEFDPDLALEIARNDFDETYGIDRKESAKKPKAQARRCWLPSVVGRSV
jgi:hypothetical protein